MPLATPAHTTIYTATVTTRPNEYGEYVVRFYRQAVRMPDADYFTDDIHDAHSTAWHSCYVLNHPTVSLRSPIFHS